MLTPPTIRFCASHAVCPEMNAVFLPLATTIWENPCGKLGKSVFGLTCSFGMKSLPADSGVGPTDLGVDGRRAVAAIRRRHSLSTISDFLQVPDVNTRAASS